MIKKDKGFTLLEVMIAIAIFGFLMIIISQLMHGEMRLINNAAKKTELENKARTALMHVLDEIRLNRLTYYSGGSGQYDSGVYRSEIVDEEDRQANQICLINVNPNLSVLNGNYEDLPEGTKIFYNKNDKKLWYRNLENNKIHLIADDIYEFAILKVTDHLVRLYVLAGDPTSSASYELLTWARLY